MDFLKRNRLILHLFLGAALVAIYPMQGLFSGNQNIYFLWGAANLLPDAFPADPLLQSPDPYPLFSWLISIFPFQFLGIWTTVLYILLNAVYSFALLGIADSASKIYRCKSRFLSFTVLFLLIHSAPIWGTYLNLAFDVDLRWMWDSGIAEQGVLRGYLQPSVFGVFLLLSFHFACKRNFSAAILAIAPAAAIHANYLFLGGVLTLIYLIQARFERKAVFSSIPLLLAVLPYTTYLLNSFVQLNPELKSAIDNAVMAGFDSNIHINPTNWINSKFFGQMLILTLGSAAIWQTRFRNLFFSIAGTAITLTIFAYATQNTTLISLNPWRLSVLLVPISSIVLLSRIVSGGSWSLIRTPLSILAATICAATLHYRLFGNGTEAFITFWQVSQLLLFVLGAVVFYFVTKKFHLFSRILELTLILGLVLLGVTDTYLEQLAKTSSPQFKVINHIHGSEPNSLYIIPPDWTYFRMNAEKAVYADKNLVYGPALPDLTKRLEMATTAYQSGDFSKVLNSIPTNTAVKLILENGRRPANVASEEAAGNNHTCYVLRQ